MRNKRVKQHKTRILELSRQVLSSMDGHIRPVISKLSREIGGFHEADIYLTQLAVGLTPEPFGLGHIYNRMPYTNPDRLKRQLKEAVERGWLFVVSEGVYQATERGHGFYRRLCRDYECVYTEIKSLPLGQLDRINELLGTLIGSIRQNSELNYKPAFDMDNKLAHQGIVTLQRICCKLSMLLAYRDDTFINAWMDQEINSYVWEAFSYIYKGRANTASKIARKLESCRQYSEAAYVGAVQELAGRGWIERKNGIFEPTEEGLRILAHVTHTTNTNFFAPWSVLQKAEAKELKDLLEALVEVLMVTKPSSWLDNSSVNRNLGWRSMQWVRDNVR